MKAILVSRNSFFLAALAPALEQDGIKTVASMADLASLDAIRDGITGAADVVVIDSGAGLCGQGYRRLSALHARRPNIRTLLVVPGFDAALLSRIFACGSAGCVQSTAPLHIFPYYVRLAAEGQRVFPDGTVDELKRLLKETQPPANLMAIKTCLTCREGKVLTHLLRGAPNKEIANALRLPLTTVKGDVKAIMQKTGASNRTALAVSAVQAGFGLAGLQSAHLT